MFIYSTYADINITVDFNECVKVNYKKFGDLLGDVMVLSSSILGVV